jgi:hypothetical protein
MDLATCRAMRQEILARNAASPNPLPLCRKCGWMFQEADRDWLFKNLCSTCAIRKVERMLWKIVRRHGRRRAWRLIRHLARGKKP